MDLKEIVHSRAEVSHLLKQSLCSSEKRVSQWVSPHESSLSVFEYDLLDDPSKISSLLDLHKEIFSHRKYHALSRKSRATKKLFVKFDTSEMAESTPSRPSLSEVKSMIETGELYLAVYSMGGYNFSLEFTHVYGGENSIDTSYSDLLAILCRAVRALDPSIKSEQAQIYGEHIIRVAAWEVQIANLTCMATLMAKFPSIKAKILTDVKYSVPSIYLGTTDDLSLCFWVRMCPSVESKSDDISELRDADKQYEKHTSFCYYRYHPLSLEICEELDLAGFADSTTGEDGYDKETAVHKPNGAVLPPPKRPMKNEMLVSMLLRNISGVDNKAKTEMDEVSIAVENEFDEGIAENSHDVKPEYVSTSDSPEVVHNAQDMDSNKIGFKIDIADNLSSKSSPFAELWAWGRNTAYLFDKTKDKVSNRSASMLDSGDVKQMEDHDTNYVCFQPSAITIPPSIHLERIRMIACSTNHMLLLTYNGSLYSSGDNTEGALGLGDTKNRHSLDLVLWPTSTEDDDSSLSNDESHRHVVSISAGAAAIGAHSMAITESGDLYGWGVAYAAGQGTAKKAITTPMKIFIPQPASVIDKLRAEKRGHDANENAAFMSEAEAELQRYEEMEAAGSSKVRQVSCGGGFTVAVLASGHMASWGMWSHGRLGLGTPPKVEGETQRARGRNKKKVVRYQLRPRLLPKLENVAKVSCGEAHCLCLTKNGDVYAWGQNSCGQVGNGPTSSGFLRDAMEPTLISFFEAKSSSASKEANHIVDVCAGTFHSLAKDATQGVWSWGGRGDTCLGHNDPALTGTWASRVSAVFSPSTNFQKILVPFELMEWCKSWARPRLIKSLVDANDKILQLTAGDMHSGVLMASGRFHLCGTGPVVPPILIRNETHDNEGSTHDEQDESKGEEGGEASVDDVMQDLNERMVTVATPRCPSAVWLDKVSMRATKYMCSAGTFMVIIQDEDLICTSLTQKLFRNTTNNSITDVTDSVSGKSLPEKRSILPVIGRGKPDCLLVVAGKILAAHRGLVSMRSAVLREKLVEEAPVDDGLEGSIFTPTQVLMPDMVTETGNALHMFLYTGVLPPRCVRNLAILKNLQVVGRRYRLPRLIVACDRLIKIHEAASQSFLKGNDIDSDDEDDDDDNSSLMAKSHRIRVDSSKKNFIHSVFSDLNLELPPSTLGRDLGSLVGDSQYADVRFIAEGRSISAHRFILEARCEYFRLLFNSGLSESLEFQKVSDGSADNEVPPVVDIVVPDTFVGLLRLLIFLYTDVLPDGADGAILEDLMSADRYQVHDMKRLCESMLVPSHDNWIDLLRAAMLFNSPQLEADVMSFLRDNVDDILKFKDQGLLQEFPNLLSDVMQIRRASYPLPPAQSLVEYTANVAKEAKERQEKFHMPWWAIATALFAAFTYQHVIRVVSLGILVPIVNLVMFLGVLYYFYYSMMND